jgi:hypothetical protein
MKIFFCILFAGFIWGCKHGDTKNSVLPGNPIKKMPMDTQKNIPLANPVVGREDKILDSLQKISFVISSNRYIDSITGHKKGIAFIIDSSGTEWMIQAGYNGEERFETYHWFYVNPAILDIKVYDVVNDEKLSIEDYLKKGN